MTDLREALEQLRLDQPAHAEAEEYWLLPSAFNSVLAAARAYADLLDRGQEIQSVRRDTATIINLGYTEDEPGRYFVAPVGEDEREKCFHSWVPFAGRKVRCQKCGEYKVVGEDNK